MSVFRYEVCTATNSLSWTPSVALGPRRREGMSSVLDGVRVIDFGQSIAGPLTGMLLADQGADVMRVESPGGPMWGTPANATLNRGKRSILLDLKSEAGRDASPILKN